MGKLYCVPLGSSARGYFINKISQHGWEDSLLILPSGVLQSRAFKEGAVRVKNFDDVATGLLNANGYTGLKRISRRTQELIVEEILQKYAQENQLNYFNVLVEKKGFVKAVTSLIGQLSRSGAKMEEIYEALNGWDRQGKLGLKDREIADVYTAYRQKLKKEDWFDVEGLYRLAVYVLQKDEPVVPWHNLYFSEFYHFDGLQTELLRELQRHCEINIGLMYDAKRPEIFAAVQNTFLDLSGFLDFEKLESESLERAESLQILTDELGGEGAALYNGSGITLLEAASREQEVRTVLRSIKKLLLQGVSSSEIIILLRDFSFYAGLRNLSDEYGIPVSLPQTAKLNNEPLTEFMYLLVKNAAYSAPQSAVTNLWELLGCQAIKLLFKLDVEKLLRMRADKYYQSAEAFISEAATLLDDNEKAEFTRLLDLAQHISGTSDINGYCAALGDILKMLALPELLGNAYKSGVCDAQAIKHYLLTANKLNDILQILQNDYAAGGMSGKKISAQDFAVIFYEAMQSTELVLQKGDMNGVLITEVSNIQGVSYKHVFLLGVREGEFPSVRTENWIYNDYERAVMASLGIDLPGTIAGLNEDKYFFAAAAAAAIQHLTVSWHCDDQGGASAYVEMLQNVFAANSLKITMVSPVGVDNALSENELTEKLASAYRNSCFLASKINAWQQRTDIEYLRDNGFDNYSGVLQDEALKAKLPFKIGSSFSASKLETYAGCPFKFMVSYLWRQQEYSETDENIEPADEGSLMHACAAEFIGHYFNKKISSYALEDLYKEMIDIFETQCRNYQQSGKLKDTVLLQYQKEEILSRLLKFVRAEYAYSEEWHGYKPLAAEMQFGPGTGLPLNMDVGAGESISLQGRIDRIDTDGTGIFITDYKRSSVPDTKAMKQGLDLQMPVYLLAADRLTQDKTVIGGGYFSFAAGERKNGIFFDNNKKPPFFGARAAASDWNEFTNAAEEFITGYVTAMRSGDFKPQPHDICSPYCPARGICRRYGAKTGGGAD